PSPFRLCPSSFVLLPFTSPFARDHAHSPAISVHNPRKLTHRPRGFDNVRRPPMRRSLLLLLLALALLLPFSLLAQSHATTGDIEGTVIDGTGSAVPGVTVTAKNTATNFESVVVTDATGRFRAVLLPLGPYQVTAHLEGFATVVQQGLNLGVGQTLRVTITLKQATA